MTVPSANPELRWVVCWRRPCNELFFACRTRQEAEEWASLLHEDDAPCWFGRFEPADPHEPKSVFTFSVPSPAAIERLITIADVMLADALSHRGSC